MFQDPVSNDHEKEIVCMGKKMQLFFNGCSVGIWGHNHMSAPSCCQWRERWPSQLSAIQWDDKTIDKEAHISNHAGSLTRLFKFMFHSWDKWKKEPCRHTELALESDKKSTSSSWIKWLCNAKKYMTACKKILECFVARRHETAC